jgi:hypothetical protein
MLGPLLAMFTGGVSGPSNSMPGSFNTGMGQPGTGFGGQPGFGQQPGTEGQPGFGGQPGMGGQQVVNSIANQNLQCPRNYFHTMLVKSLQTVYNCDGCRAQRPPGEAHYRCDADNLDFCPNCRPTNQSNWGGGQTNQAPFDPRGHQMIFKSGFNAYNCDKCRRQYPQGDIHARCDSW